MKKKKSNLEILRKLFKNDRDKQQDKEKKNKYNTLFI